MNIFYSLYSKGFNKTGYMENEHVQFITIRFKIHKGVPLLPKEQEIWEKWLQKTGQPAIVEMSPEDEEVVAFVLENQMTEEEFLESLRQRKKQKEEAGNYSIQSNEDAGVSATTPSPYIRNVPSRKQIAVAAITTGLVLTGFLAWYFQNSTKWISVTTGFRETKQFTLPDGSKSWLQAKSTLEYPEDFSDNREIRINGEAYFEVTPDQRRPFIVKSDQQSVKVLGTAFNINSYKKDSVIRTSVKLGSVLVTAGNSQQMLQAGQQTTLRAGKLTLVSPDDITEAMAWRKDSFFFKNMYISEIVAELERNYDVKMVFSNGMNDDKYTLSNFSRKDPITKILKMIENTNNVQFVLPNSPVKKGDVIIIRKIQ